MNLLDMDGYRDLIGMKVEHAEMKYETLYLRLEGGVTLEVTDTASYCCESRHMTCDDTMLNLVGNKLTHVEENGVTSLNEEDSYSEHDVLFVEVGTDHGFVTLACHNEHNGYYGGWDTTLTRGQA